MSETLTEEEVADEFTRIFQFVLAGLEGRTNGIPLKSIRLQSCGDAGFRVVLKGDRESDSGGRVGVVAFTNADSPGECMALVEAAYRKNGLRWHIDEYAGNASANGSAKSKVAELVILD